MDPGFVEPIQCSGHDAGYFRVSTGLTGAFSEST